MTDLTVRGAGIFGLAIAWAAARRGAAVRVVDPHGVGAGASGGIVGALAPHTPDNWTPKKALQLESLLMHRTFWADVSEASGHDPGYAPTGRLQPLADNRAVDLAHARAETAQETWGDTAIWQVTDAPGDWAPPSPTGLWVHDTLSAHLHPRRAVDALAAALATLNVEIVEKAADAGTVVWATGAQGLRDLSNALGREVGVGVKGQAALIDHDAAGAPQVFAGGLHIVPHLDGTVAIGSTTERDFDNATSTDDQLDDVVARARAAMPALGDAPVIARWAGVRPRARTRAPMVGHWPGRTGHIVANGGFKIGFGIAPVVARMVTDLALDGIDRIPEDFRVEASL